MSFCCPWAPFSTSSLPLWSDPSQQRMSRRLVWRPVPWTRKFSYPLLLCRNNQWCSALLSHNGQQPSHGDQMARSICQVIKQENEKNTLQSNLYRYFEHPYLKYHACNEASCKSLSKFLYTFSPLNISEFFMDTVWCYMPLQYKFIISFSFFWH